MGSIPISSTLPIKRINQMKKETKDEISKDFAEIIKTRIQQEDFVIGINEMLKEEEEYKLSLYNNTVAKSSSKCCGNCKCTKI